MESPRLSALGRLVDRRRDEVAAAVMLVSGQLVVWLAEPGGDALRHGGRPWNAVVDGMTALPLAWRRRAPLGSVVAVVVTFCLTQVVAPHGLPFYTGFGPLLILTASAGWHARGSRGVAAIVVALAGLTVCEAAEPSLRHVQRIADGLWLLVPWALLRALRARDDGVRRLAGELAVVEATQEVRRREVVAEERARIARDLHDVVAHATSVMVIQVGAARMRHAAGEQNIAEQLAAAESTGRQAIAELRRLLDVLRTWPVTEDDGPSTATTSGPVPSPPQPRLDELDTLVSSYRAAGLCVDIETGLPAEAVPLGVQVSAYRIVQEALTNSLRHGAGRPVTVGLALDGDDLVIEVSEANDLSHGGRCPPRPAPPVRGGRHGLVGMAERARLLGGSVSAGPNPSGGWSVLARLPVAVDQPVRPVSA